MKRRGVFAHFSCDGCVWVYVVAICALYVMEGGEYFLEVRVDISICLISLYKDTRALVVLGALHGYVEREFYVGICDWMGL